MPHSVTASKSVLAQRGFLISPPQSIPFGNLYTLLLFYSFIHFAHQRCSIQCHSLRAIALMLCKVDLFLSWSDDSACEAKSLHFLNFWGDIYCKFMHGLLLTASYGVPALGSSPPQWSSVLDYFFLYIELHLARVSPCFNFMLTFLIISFVFTILHLIEAAELSQSHAVLFTCSCDSLKEGINCSFLWIHLC